MSTHANIKIISKSGEKLYYQHYDGYPNGLGKVLEKYIVEQSQYHDWDPDVIGNALVDGTFGTPWDIKRVSKIAGDVSYVYNINCINKTFEIEKWKWVTNEENILLSHSEFDSIVSQKTF
jgi:hypothetical protein